MTNSLHRLANLLAVTLFLSACQSSPKIASQPFEVATPKEGSALMYLFRPKLDKVGRSDKPTLLIDNQVVAVLGYSTYTAVSLRPGTHRLKLLAGSGDSSAWNTELGFEVSAGQTHFVAIWNQNQPGSSNIIAPVHTIALQFFVPIIGSVAEGVYVNNIMSRSVRLEPVEQDVGSYALVELQHVSAQFDDIPSIR